MERFLGSASSEIYGESPLKSEEDVEELRLKVDERGGGDSDRGNVCLGKGLTPQC